MNDQTQPAPRQRRAKGGASGARQIRKVTNMIRRILIAIFFIGFCFAKTVSADEGIKQVSTAETGQAVPVKDREKSMTGSEIVKMTLLAEVLFGVNALLASENPRVYGAVGVLLFPIAAESKSSEVTRWVTLGAAEALAIYNITIDKNKMSKGDIFKANFIGWHAFAGVVAITGYFAGDFDKNISLSYMTEPHGGKLMLSYRF